MVNAAVLGAFGGTPRSADGLCNIAAQTNTYSSTAAFLANSKPCTPTNSVPVRSYGTARLGKACYRPIGVVGATAQKSGSHS
jgi:hypothetical protein